MWECLHCGESVEDILDACWRCQAGRDGRPTHLATPARDAEEEAEISFLNRKDAARDCLRCHGAMKYAGRKEFHEGINWGVAGDFGELFVGRLHLDTYVCPECLHVEFFAADPS